MYCARSELITKSVKYLTNSWPTWCLMLGDQDFWVIMCHLPPTAEWSWIMETNLQQNHDNKTLNTNTEHTNSELPPEAATWALTTFSVIFSKMGQLIMKRFSYLFLGKQEWSITLIPFTLSRILAAMSLCFCSFNMFEIHIISYYNDIQYLSLKCFHPLIFRVVQHAFASKLRIDGVILNSQAQQQDVPCERHGSRPWCDYPSLDPTRVGCTIPYTVHWHIIMSQYVSYCIISQHVML